MAKKGFVEEPSVFESRDGKTRIRQFLRITTNTSTVADAATTSSRSRHSASMQHLLIAGFASTGLVGSISANFIIERKDMHQIAPVDSEFIIPTVTYIGYRLRHPFRIYTDKRGLIYVIVCETPLMPEGVHNIMDLVMSWAVSNGIREIITLDGIAVDGWPSKDSQPIVLRSNHHDGQQLSREIGSGSSGRSGKSIRGKKEEDEKGDKPKIQLKQGNGDATGNGGNNNNGNAAKPVASDSQQLEGQLNRLTVMTGVSAALLSACLSHDVPCRAVLIPTSRGVPDPEGAAMLLQTISAMPNVPLELGVSALIQQGKEIKSRLEATIASIQQQNGEGQLPSASSRRSMIYG